MYVEDLIEDWKKSDDEFKEYIDKNFPKKIVDKLQYKAIKKFFDSNSFDL